MTGWMRSKNDCYCAFCKTKRHIYPKKHASTINLISVMAFAFCLSTGLWTWWDPRAIVIFAVALVFTEVFTYLRWRFSVVCRFCGFDPVLYRKDPHLASARVRKFYEKRTQDPDFMLSRSPLVELYRQSQKLKRRNEAIRAQQDKTSSGGGLTAPARASGSQVGMVSRP